MISGGALDSGSGLKLVESEVVQYNPHVPPLSPTPPLVGLTVLDLDLDSGSSLRLVESEVVQYNPHVPPLSPTPPFNRPDCSGSGSGLRIKFKVG